MITALRFTRLLAVSAFVFPLVCAQARAQPVPAGGEFEVTPVPSYKDSRPRVAADANGRFVVVWEFQDYDSATEGIKAPRFDSDGTPLGGEFFVSTQPTYDERFPDVASGSSEFVVTWWERDPPSHGWRLMGRRLDADGVPLGYEFTVNVSSWFRGDRAKVALDGINRFVVVWWNAYVDGDQLGNGGGGVLARRYDNDGAPLSSEFVVNETTAYVQLQPDVAMHPDGDFVVVWSNMMTPPPDYVQQTDIRGRRYDSTGSPVGGEFMVSTSTGHAKLVSSVAMNDLRQFVVVWEDEAQPSQRLDIFGRRFRRGGIPEGGEFQVNNLTTLSTYAPQAVIAEDGSFMVVWNRGLDLGVSGRTFDSAGVPQGGEMLVNEPASAPEGWPEPDAAIDASGVPVIVWPSLQYLDWPQEYHVAARQFEPFVCNPLPGRVTDLDVGWSVPGSDMSFTWTDTHDADNYLLYQDGFPGGAFVNLKAAAYSAADGITLPVPSGTTYYLLAASNQTCGEGALRLP